MRLCIVGYNGDTSLLLNQVDGPMHRMVHMHGDIASLLKETLQLGISALQEIGHVHLVKDTSAEVPFN